MHGLYEAACLADVDYGVLKHESKEAGHSDDDPMNEFPGDGYLSLPALPNLTSSVRLLQVTHQRDRLVYNQSGCSCLVDICVESLSL